MDIYEMFEFHRIRMISSMSTNMSIRTVKFWGVLFILDIYIKCATGTSHGSALINSTIACTRGTDQRIHMLDCITGNGTAGMLAVKRLFYGATPTTSGCDRKSPYDNCCRQDTDNCLFSSDFKLDQAVIKCTSKPRCRFYGQSVNSVRGNCDPTKYPSITSFSFIEFLCLSRDHLTNICPKEETNTEALTLYLDSNHEHDNGRLDGEDCKCILYTRCGATVTLEAIMIQFRMINTTDCVEEITLQDLKDPSIMKKYTCHDHHVNLAINNIIMINNTSNAVFLKLHIFDRHNGKILISATSSDASSALGMKCGPNVTPKSLPSEYYCSGDVVPNFTAAPKVTTQKSEDKEVNEGLQNDKIEGNKVRIVESSSQLHEGAIAGIVLAIVGIILVLSQVVYFLMRRRQKHIEQQETGNSNLPPSQMVNPTFQHDNDLDDDHVYDMVMGTVSGRTNPVYNVNAAQDEDVLGATAGPKEKDLTNLFPEVVDNSTNAFYEKEFMHGDPPPPYDSHDD